MKYLLIIMVALAIPVHAVDLADGLVAEWTFEEGEGNVVRDTSDNNNNGVLHNEPEWVEDGIGTALRLDGIDDYVDCGTTALIDLTETVSLEAWVKPEKPSTGEPLIAGKSIYAYGLTWTGSSIYFYISDGAWKASTPLPLRQWSHVVGTYDGTRMLLYVNGELASGFVMTEPNTPIKSRGTSAMIGRLAKAYYCGAVDNVRIFSRPLSQKEVKKHYEQEKSKLKQPKLTPIDQLTGLARQVREAGDKSATLTIDSKQQVTADVTVPHNVALQFVSGGSIDVAKDAVLSIKGPVTAAAVHIFTGDGRVAFLPGAVEHVYPHWWGAVGDGLADDAPAIQAAVDALPSGGTVRFRGGSFNVGATITVQNGITLQGPGKLRSRTALPAIVAPVNPAARSGAWRISRMRFNGRAVNGDRSAIGIDMTNVCSSLLEDVKVGSCDIGIKMDGPVFCGYNHLNRLSIGACDIGIEMSNSTIKTSLFSSNIGEVDVGLSIKTTNELDAFGVSIEGFRTAGVDVLRGDTVHLHHFYFANNGGGTGIRIAPGVSECTIVNPRYSHVETQIDDQAGDTIVLDNKHPSKQLRTGALYVDGISAGKAKARNLRGRVTIAGTEQRITVKFDQREKDADYYAVATAATPAPGNDAPAGATQVRLADNTRDGFTIILAAAPGEGRAVTVDWILVR